MRPVAILWKRLDVPGFDSCTLGKCGTGSLLSGVALFAHRGKPCRLDYSVSTDSMGRTRRARIEGQVGLATIDISIAADRARRWRLNGRTVPAVDGCDDIDLSFSPCTNALAIRRLALPVGGRAPVRAAWLRFPHFTLHPLDQVYVRRSRFRYGYQTSTGFRVELEVKAAGVVSRYGRHWRAIS